MTKFIIDKSPFKFERDYHARSVSKSFRLPEDVYNELMEYYYSIHGENNNLTKAFNDIAIDKLDNICRERKSYQDLNILMLIPKTDDVDELNKKSEIIGFFNIDDVSEVNRELLVRDESEDKPLIKYIMNPDGLERAYEVIKYINPNCFNFNMKDISSFDDFKIRLNKSYQKIDLDNVYILQLELNNYFDVFREGEYQSYTLNNTHEGAYVFVDYSLKEDGDVENRKLYCNIQWNYNLNVLNIDFDFTFDARFHSRLQDDKERDNQEIKDEIKLVINDGDRKKSLLEDKEQLTSLKNRLEGHLKLIDDVLRKNYPEVFED